MIKVQNRIEQFQNNLIAAFYYTLRIAVSTGVSYFLAQCIIFENFSPFTLILLSVSTNIGLIPTFCYFGGALGVLLNAFDLSTFKYLTALTMVYVIYMVFQKSMHIIKHDTAVLTAACCFTSGFLFLLVGKLSLFSVLVLIGESVLICCCIYFINYAANAFKKSCYLSAKEIIAAAISMILILCALHNVYLFNLSVARILGVLLVYLALYCLKTSHAVVLGSCMGIILSTVSNGGETVFSAVVISTLAGCVFSSFSNQLGITLFITVYYATLLFLGKFPWNYWYFAEPMIAYFLMLIIPKNKLRIFLSSYIPVKQVKYKKNSVKKDLYTYCKNECEFICPRAKNCYSKNEGDLKNVFENIAEQYNLSGETPKISDAVPYCIKPEALERIIKRKIGTLNADELDELIQQMDYISKKIENSMEKGGKAIQFLPHKEENLRKALESAKIYVKEISFILNEYGCEQGFIRFEPNNDGSFEQIIRNTLFQHLKKSYILKFEDKNSEFMASFKESSRFSVQCAALCKTKEGESVTGDQAVGFSVEKNNYCLLLTDGMGSGKAAGMYSEWVSSTLKRLLQNGFSVSSALNLFRSTIRFNQVETFSTLDLCMLDLERGIGDFYKCGAYDSFLLKNDAHIIIKGGGIPFGLAEQDHIQHEVIHYLPGDYLIMASDGLLLSPAEYDSFFNSCKNDDVKLFAKNILLKYKSEHQTAGNDDITVLVCKFNATT